jgi:hypothetical protein
MSKTTTTRKVRVVRKPVVKGIPVGVPVNVKVRGERTMLKGVTLHQHATNKSLLTVRTGGRGRPSHLPIDRIESVRAL